MKHKFIHLPAALLLIGLAISSLGLAQNNSVIDQGELDNLIVKKVALDKEGKFKDRFTVQLYYGGNQEANTILKKYENLHLSWEGRLVYEAPNHKVWIGSYRSKLDADRALLEIKKEFPNAFILKPER